MLGWLIRGIMIFSGFIASFFIARDALKFPIFQMVIAVLLSALLVGVAAFWPWPNWYKNFLDRFRKKKD